MLLAFDTSGNVGSVAVAHGADVLGRAFLTRQAGHASGLIQAIEDALEDAGVDRRELSGIVVGEGPGSFTGVRVAAATAKGLVHALGLPVWAVSSLAGTALAESSLGSDPVAPRYVLFDARAERVYGGCWLLRPDQRIEVVSPHAGEISDVLGRELARETVFVGDGAEKHRALIEGAGFRVVATNPDYGVADGLIRFHTMGDTEPVADPAGWEPAYVRVSGAERLWTT